MTKDTVKSYWLWAVKIIAATYNARATASVFYDILIQAGYSYGWVVFDTVLAVILIDIMFIYLLTEIEDRDTDPFERFPYVVTVILLSVIIVAIGYVQEGWLAIAPRSGLLVLVFSDISRWYTQRRFKYQSREYQEQKIRDEEVLLRKAIDKETYAEVLKSEPIKELFRERHRTRISGQLNVSERSEPEELPENVEVLDDGTIAWRTPKGELITEKKTGGVYKNIRGAQIAAARAWSKNGH